MVEMARAIVDRPQILLLDEPTSGLEESDVILFGQTMQKVRAEESSAIVLVEHDVEFVMSQCDTISVLNLGEKIAEGTPEAIRNDPVVGAAYLG
jgi:branched-chain amino acid transport system ATP-binding protein